MAKVLFRLLLILMTIAAIIALIGYLIPRNYSTTVSVTIDAPIDEVFDNVNRTEAWTNWSPWSPKRIDELTVDYDGPKQGEGAIMTWDDPRPNDRFDGRLEIIESIMKERIEFSIRMGEVPMDGYFEFIESDGKTTVTWTTAGELPSGVSYGWFALGYNNFLNNELNASLQRLKESIESAPKQAAPEKK